MTPSAVLRIEHARVLTCESLDVIDDGGLLAEDGRIVWVGRHGSEPEGFAHTDPSSTIVIDGTGLTLMPGLVDAHMHISFGEAASEEELSIHTPGAYRAIRAAVDAKRVLDAGVTSACDPGGPQGIAVAVRDAIEAGLVPGPRLAAAGRQITTQLGIGDTLPSALHDIPGGFGKFVRTAADIVQEIRDEVKDGVDLIKIAGSGPGTEEYGAFSVDELHAAVTEAHRVGKPIAIHARSRRSIADAVSTGFDWIMHASFIDAETIEKVVRCGVPIVPALTLLANSLEAGPGVMTQRALDSIRRELDTAVASLGKAYAEGATLIAGSETGFAMTPYGVWHTRELELFVDFLGLTDHQALLTMTKDAAVAVPRHSDSIGTLTAGKFADCLLVEGQPDHNVRLLADRKNLRFVIKGGSIVAPDTTTQRTRQSFERTRLYVHGLHLRGEGGN
jgi:imidazolonepropionase-like amidohydrolase